MDVAFADLLGYTETNLQQYFGAYIKRAAALFHMSEEQLCAELKARYGGFCFDEDAAVTLYHPFAINSFFAQLYYTSKVPPVFESYWCDSPRSIRTLRTFFEAHYPELAFLETVKSRGITLMQDALNSAVVFDHIRFATLLVQQGYLSIKANLTPNEGDSLACQLHFNFTNAAAEDLYHSVLVGYLTQSQTNAADAAMILKMLQIATALREGDWRGLVEVINFFLDQLRTSSYSNADAAKYRSMLTSFLCCAVGSKQVCAPANEGRADVEVLVGDSIFALELKLAPSTASPEDYPELASNLRLNKTTYNRMVRQGSSSDFGYLPRAIKHWYGVVLVLEPQSHRICYWRAFSPRKERGAGLVPAVQQSCA